jgi:hypothetical protein
MNDRLFQLALTQEELWILQNALNNARQFIPETEFSAVMGVQRDEILPLMERLRNLEA